jgi:histidyl-tRNA synthetase
MSKKTEPSSPEARLPKGLFDVPAGEIRATEAMLGTIRRVFESYGFEPLDTPAIEYTDPLGSPILMTDQGSWARSGRLEPLRKNQP